MHVARASGMRALHALVMRQWINNNDSGGQNKGKESELELFDFHVGLYILMHAQAYSLYSIFQVLQHHVQVQFKKQATNQAVGHVRMRFTLLIWLVNTLHPLLNCCKDLGKKSCNNEPYPHSLWAWRASGSVFKAKRGCEVCMCISLCTIRTLLAQSFPLPHYSPPHVFAISVLYLTCKKSLLHWMWGDSNCACLH